MTPQALLDCLQHRGATVSADAAETLCRLTGDCDDELVRTHFNRVRRLESYLRDSSVRQIAGHLELLSKLNDQQLVTIAGRENDGHDGFLVEIAGVDLLGVSACITGSLAEMGLSIVGMDVVTYLPDVEAEDADSHRETQGVRRPGKYIMTFEVDEGDHPIDPRELVDSLRTRLKAAYWHLLRGDVQRARHEADEPDELLGRIIDGRFRIDRHLTRGGMGTIYLATQLDLQRPVIVKVLRPECSLDPVVSGMFQREANLLAQTQSPHVVHIYATGKIDDRIWMALEYMVGGDVEHWTARHGVPPFALAAQWLQESLSGLEYIHHDAGVVHCDIKPGNLLLDAGRKLKLGDLGLSQMDQGNRQPDADGRIRGTLWYISPEQARGEPLDARSDLFSLGSSFYHILSRVRPFDASAPAQILARVSHGECDPLARIAPDVPAGIATVIERLMQPDPIRRYQNARVALADLHSYLGVRPVRDSLATAEAVPPERTPPNPPQQGDLETTQVRLSSSG
ncbi:MAG: hypothetical protein CMJ48_07365 [Planctomycetaceae bacterium]|nr:hypothetical protein [Planctomycetaceae bacterium]